jgi:hypothetical protein
MRKSAYFLPAMQNQDARLRRALCLATMVGSAVRKRYGFADAGDRRPEIIVQLFVYYS